MAHLPSTLIGRLYLLFFVAAGIPLIVWVSVVLSGPVVWISIAAVALVVLAVVLRIRQLDARRERAYDPTLGFANVVAKMRADNARAEVRKAEERARRSAAAAAVAAAG